MLKHLDLFSGIGGFSLGLEQAGMQTVAFCENDKFCQKVLRKHWPNVPIFDDIRVLKGNDIEQPIDILTGGFPCQPYSVAGKQKGSADDRALWPEMFRVIQESKPTWIIGENVPPFKHMGLDDCITSLEGEGYEVQAFIIPACGIGAPHRRDRVWILAYDGIRKPVELSGGEQECRNGTGDSGKDVANANSSGRTQKTKRGMDLARNILENPTRRKGSIGPFQVCPNADEAICNSAIAGLPDWAGGEMGQPCPITEFERSDGREVERNFCGVAYGISRRVDRLRALGNAVVPQMVEVFGAAIMAIENDKISTIKKI